VITKPDNLNVAPDFDSKEDAFAAKQHFGPVSPRLCVFSLGTTFRKLLLNPRTVFPRKFQRERYEPAPWYGDPDSPVPSHPQHIAPCSAIADQFDGGLTRTNSQRLRLHRAAPLEIGEKVKLHAPE